MKKKALRTVGGDLRGAGKFVLATCFGFGVFKPTNTDMSVIAALSMVGIGFYFVGTLMKLLGGDDDDDPGG